MTPSKVDADLDARLAELRETHGGEVKIEEVDEVVRSLLSTLTGDISSGDLELVGELEELSHYIEGAKAEIAALRPDEVKEEFLPTATDELDAIVEATAEATHSIMDATELIEQVSEKIDAEGQDKLMEATTKIYEACGFQDITGQRITKVVSALKHIEEKIDALVAAFGHEIDDVKKQQLEEARKAEEDRERTDQDLLEGPQMANTAQSQAEIDALLASFD